MQRYAKTLGASLILSLPLIAQVQAQEVDGTALYSQHCVKCHGKDGRANTLRGWFTSAQDLTDSVWQAETSDADILEAFERGPRSMPSYAKKLNAAEQNALVQTVRGLQR